MSLQVQFENAAFNAWSDEETIRDFDDDVFDVEPDFDEPDFDEEITAEVIWECPW